MLKKTELKAIRETFEQNAGHDLRLTDDAISALVERDKSKFEEMDTDDAVQMFLKAEDAFKGIAIADPGITALVNKMDDAFNAELDACIGAIIKNKTTAIDIYAQFKRLYNKATLDACPMPGTEADDVKGTNYKPDIVEKPAVAGGTIRTVFIHDWVQATPKGKLAQGEIDDVKAEEKTAGSTRFKGKSKKDLKAILSAATQVRNGMRSMFTRALKLHHQLSAIDGMRLVKYEWINGNSEKHVAVPDGYQSKKNILVTLAPKPFWFMPVNPDTMKEMGSEGRDFSVTQVLAFDVREAIKKGGTLGNLVDSAKTTPDTPEQQGEKLSTEAFDTGLVVFNAKLSNTEERAALRKRALEKGNETLRSSCCALYLNLAGFYKANAKWYEEQLNGAAETPEGTSADGTSAAA